jgi:hypothetical protein
MATVLPEEDRTEDGLSCDRTRSFDMQTAPKVALPDGILHRFRPQLFPRDPWLLMKGLGEDKAHLEPLDQRRDATSREEAMGELLYIHLQP